jgi:predicted RNase H-like HicB family nuclease
MTAVQSLATTQHQYSVIVTYDPDSNLYLADVPALGFITEGFSAEHAFEMAGEAISGRLETMAAHGQPIPVEEHPIEVRQLVI